MLSEAGQPWGAARHACAHAPRRPFCGLEAGACCRPSHPIPHLSLLPPSLRCNRRPAYLTPFSFPALTCSVPRPHRVSLLSTAAFPLPVFDDFFPPPRLLRHHSNNSSFHKSSTSVSLPPHGCSFLPATAAASLLPHRTLAAAPLGVPAAAGAACYCVAPSLPGAPLQLCSIWPAPTVTRTLHLTWARGDGRAQPLVTRLPPAPAQTVAALSRGTPGLCGLCSSEGAGRG